MTGPGEQVEKHARQPVWIRLHLPEASVVRAAAWGCEAGLRIRLEGVVCGVRVWERLARRQPVRPAAPRGGAMPQRFAAYITAVGAEMGGTCAMVCTMNNIMVAKTTMKAGR